MATKTETVWNNIIDILNTAKTKISGSLTYVKYISQGIRDDLESYPLIVVEPNREDETQITVPHNKRIVFSVLIRCVMMVNNRTNQIVGSNPDNSKGILDFVADVKNVLNANRTLNGNALKMEFPTTLYIFETYPYRIADITMNIEIISQDNNR